MRAHDWPRYHYTGDPIRVIDGDTLVVLLDLGDDTYRTRAIRLASVDTPELRAKDPTERLAAAQARLALVALVAPGMTLRRLYLRTYKDATSFERLVADVYVADDAGELVSLADLLIAAGHGVPAEG